MWFAALFAASTLIMLSLAAFGIGRFVIGDQAVERGVWFRAAGPLLLLTGCLMAGIAYGFRTEKAWSRHLVMTLWIVVALYALFGLLGGLPADVPRQLMWRALIEAFVFGSIAAWYFYAKRNVVEYFSILAQH